MIPLADLHCHLLAGLDDGPRSAEDALAMCRTAHAEGTRLVAALAHQNERWGAVTPALILEAVRRLEELVRLTDLPVALFPCAEIMACPDLESLWAAGRLLSVANRKNFLLLEMPQNLYVDLRDTATRLSRRGLRLILAHPERHPELLHQPGAVEELIRIGCLVQVSSASVTDPADASDRRALRSWFRRGCVHLLGSDGHTPHHRLPRMAAAYREIRSWAGVAVADRVCSTTGVAILHGLPLSIPAPQPFRACSWWFW